MAIAWACLGYRFHFQEFHDSLPILKRERMTTKLYYYGFALIRFGIKEIVRWFWYSPPTHAKFQRALRSWCLDFDLQRWAVPLA
jgi:hypothetical protein